MKKQNIVPIIGIASLLFCIFGSIIRYVSDKNATYDPPVPEITALDQQITVDQFHAHVKRVLDATAPGCYTLDVDKGAGTVTIDMWSPGFDAPTLNMALRQKAYLDRWNKMTSSLAELCAQIQSVLDHHVSEDMTAVVRFVNCDDYGQVFASFERGVITYDVVADTPAGQEIPDPTSRVLPTVTANVYATYIVNIKSGVFHLPGCSFGDQIASYNRSDFHGDRADLIAQGYTPCSFCEP